MWTNQDALPNDSELISDSRRTLELLDEQIVAQGSACPRELLEVYEEVRALLRDA